MGHYKSNVRDIEFMLFDVLERGDILGSGAFEDIEALAVDCRYADCRHDREPGCAVRAALERGDLAEERMRSYRKMERELTFLAERQDGRARQRAREQGRRFKQFHREREALRSRGLAR